ncbi:MAG: tripartite tricarboxylate transporter substrate binding protein [Pseudomonadota bacterium]
MNLHHAISTFLLAALLIASPGAQSQSWPDKPVKLVLSQPAGSGTDNVARIISEQLSRTWGQPVIVDNKPGGQNMIGATAVARAPADGYTFYFATVAALTTNPLLFKNLSYDPQKDFSPVAVVARSSFGFLVESNSSIKSLDDLIAMAKSQPGKITIGIDGPRTFAGMIARLFNARTGIKANLVSYSSVVVGLQDLMGKHIDAIVTDMPAAAQFVKQGRMRLLATSGSKRVPGWEQVPAMSETIPGFDMVGWFAIVAPTGTPAVAINRFNRDIGTVLADKEVIERIAAIGPITEPPVSVENTAAFLRNETIRWTSVTREIGILAE